MFGHIKRYFLSPEAYLVPFLVFVLAHGLLAIGLLLAAVGLKFQWLYSTAKLFSYFTLLTIDADLVSSPWPATFILLALALLLSVRRLCLSFKQGAVRVPQTYTGLLKAGLIVGTVSYLFFLLVITIAALGGTPFLAAYSFLFGPLLIPALYLIPFGVVAVEVCDFFVHPLNRI